MSRLLSAGFARVMKSRIFHIALFFMIGLVIFEVALSIYDSRSRTDVVIAPIDVYLHEDMLFLGFVAAIFIGLFLGREYSDGTIRNKLIIGHSRLAVYVSNLIVCISAGMILHLVYLVILFGASLIFFREYFTNFLPGLMGFLVLQGVELLILAAYSSIFCLISMSIPSKANGAVTAIITALILLFGGIYVYEKMYAYTYYEEMASTLMGSRLRLYQFLDEFLPSCQVFHLPEWGLSKHAVHYLLYDGWIVIVTTVCGIWLFHKKDLK